MSGSWARSGQATEPLPGPSIGVFTTSSLGYPNAWPRLGTTQATLGRARRREGGCLMLRSCPLDAPTSPPRTCFPPGSAPHLRDQLGRHVLGTPPLAHSQERILCPFRDSPPLMDSYQFPRLRAPWARNRGRLTFALLQPSTAKCSANGCNTTGPGN